MAKATESQALLDSLQTGDVLLYENADIGSFFIKAALRSRVSHAGMVVRMPRAQVGTFYEHNLDYANDAPSKASLDSLHILEAVPRRGVALFPLEARLARTCQITKGLSVRRLKSSSNNGKRPKVNLSRLSKFMEENLSRRLETASSDCGPIAAYLHQVCSPCSEQGTLAKMLGEDHSAFFCTELVAEALQQLGVLREDPNTLSMDFLPNAFLSDARSPWGTPLKLTLDSACNPGYAFGPEEVLLSADETLPLLPFLKQRKRELRAALQLRNNTIVPAFGVLKWRRRTSLSSASRLR